MSYVKYMKKLSVLASALCIIAFAPLAANASIWGSIKSAGGSVVNTVTDTTQQAADETKRQAEAAAAETKRLADAAAAAAQKADEAARAQGFSNAAAAAAVGYSDSAMLATYSTYAKASGYANLAAAETAGRAAGYTSFIEQFSTAKANGFADASAAIAMGYSNKALLSTYSEYAKAANYANLVAADAGAKTLGYASYVDRLIKSSLPFAVGEFASIKQNMVKVYAEPMGRVQQLAGQATNIIKVIPAEELKKLPNNVRAGLLDVPGFEVIKDLAETCAGNVIATTQAIRSIAPQIAAMQNLQPQQLSALYRVLRTLLTKGVIDQQMAADMKTIGAAMGYFQRSFPANFSISVVADYATAATYNIGGSMAVSFAMNTFPVNGKYQSALTISAGPTVSLVKTEGLSLGFVFGLAQGNAVEAEGASYGIGSTVGSYNGGLSWALPLGWQEAVVRTSEKIITRPGLRNVRKALEDEFRKQIDQICAAPDVSGGVTLPYTEPKELAITFSAGYTHVIEKFAF